MLKRYKFITAMLVSLIASPVSYADSKVVLELSNKAGEKVEHVVSIDGRWLRVDSNPKGKADYILLDTGYQRYYDIYDNEKAYQLTQVGRLYWPETPLMSPRFKLIRKNKAVAGIRCQPVSEIGENKQAIAEHCMATSGALGLNARETTTLSRLLMIMRRTGGSMEESWIGAATPDERQVSVLSEDSAGNKMELKSVTHDKLDYKLLKIPVEYNEIKPVLPEGGALVEKKNPESDKKSSAQPVKQ